MMLASLVTTTFTVTYSDDVPSLPVTLKVTRKIIRPKLLFGMNHVFVLIESGLYCLQCMKMWFEPAVPETANSEK